MSGISPTGDTDFGDVIPTLVPTWSIEWGWDDNDIIGWNSVDRIGYAIPPVLVGGIAATSDTNTGGINPT